MMEALKKVSNRVIGFFTKISNDNLLLLSSSISYYSALALAPFILILLWVASLLGQDIQSKITNHASNNFSPQVGDMLELVFQNINEGVDIGSVSGVVGFIVLLSTCSIVFIQFRYAFDVIYEHIDASAEKTIWETIKERLVAMVVVLGGACLLIASFTLAAIVEYLVASEMENALVFRGLVFVLNFLVYLAIFSGIHYFTPSIRPRKSNVLKIASLSSIFFLIGNIVLASYLKSMAASSIYGAAGTLLVFLVWTYYSSFTIFLSVEVFEFFIRKRAPNEAL